LIIYNGKFCPSIGESKPSSKLSEELIVPENPLGWDTEAAQSVRGETEHTGF
jgi:hypothetical protein